MRVATVDGFVTLFYDGSKELYNRELCDEASDHHSFDGDNLEEFDLSDECKEYWKKRLSWQQIIIEEGVTVIPKEAFYRCYNIKRVLFSNTVIRIEEYAFTECYSLISANLPINLEHIGMYGFCGCNLISVFVPPRCRVIKWGALDWNKNLTIFNVPHTTELGKYVIVGTKLLIESPFQIGTYRYDTEKVHEWLKNINRDEKNSLHRACCSFQPLKEVLMAILVKQGIVAFKIKNEMGITPSQYLKENPYADIKEMDIIQNYVMKMMGENE